MIYKLISVGAVVACMACPVLAAETFPTGSGEDGFISGLLQDKRTYTDVPWGDGDYAIEEQGITLFGHAQYSPIMVPGTYFPAGSVDLEWCPEGYFCSNRNLLPDDDNDVGKTECPTTHPLSEIGNVSKSECYRECTADDVEHSVGVYGKYMYTGSGRNKCYPTECEPGYYVALGSANLYGGISGFEQRTALYNNLVAGTIQVVGWMDSNGEFGYAYDSLSKDEYNALIGNYAGANGFLLKYNNGEIVTGTGVYNILPSRDYCDDYTCSFSSYIELPELSYLPHETEEDANKCYCKFEYNSVKSPWIYLGDWVDPQENSCAEFCTFQYNQRQELRYAVMKFIHGSYCAPNIINITWQDADASSIAANDAGWCEYGGDIRTPYAPQYPGKKFLGWKLSTEEF